MILYIMDCTFIVVIILLFVFLLVRKYNKSLFRDHLKGDLSFPISYVINLEKHKNRKMNMITELTNLNMPYKIVKAVDKDTDYIPDFPCIDNHKPGTKAIQMSNIKVFKEVLKSNDKSDYFLMFEDDSELPPNFKENVYDLITEYPDVMVFNLDKRLLYKRYGYWPMYMSCMLIHKSLCPFLIKEMDPLTSKYMSNYEVRGVNSSPLCFHDLYVANLLHKYEIPSMCVPIVESGNYKTSIQLDERGWKINFVS